MRSSPGAPALSEELLSRIFHLLVSHSVVVDFKRRHYDPYNLKAYTAPCINVGTINTPHYHFLYPKTTGYIFLTVAKQWHRVGVPHLYNKIILSSKEQTQTLEQTLAAQEDYGRHIKCLVLFSEAAFGKDLRSIFKDATNLETLSMPLSFGGGTGVSVAGLLKGLPLISPRELILHDTLTYRNGINRVTHTRNCPDPLLKKDKEVIKCLGVCFEKNWDQLESFWAAFPNQPGRYDSITRALAKSPKLHTIYIRDDDALEQDYIDELPHLKKVVIQGEEFEVDLEDSVGYVVEFESWMWWVYVDEG
ncbi:hypothetical protein R3P38DRAFT_3222865 [Favolaschia claudopus]|uniref:Uncharacterized protein n=1 Tax=Favolaschia claudopus TaxID=2862362 RepID=A0AAV9ZXV8_9AGAR